MASLSLNKKRKEEIIEEESGEESSSSEEDEDSESEIDPQLEVQVEFEARSPEPSDFDGIKRLLKQLLLKAHINLSEVTDVILGQPKVGSVLKCVSDEPDDDDEEDDNETYGITTIINLNQHKEKPSIRSFQELLTKYCKSDKLLNILKDPQHTIGWLINERFINIPPHIAPPLYASLRSEVKTACNKGKPFNFDYIVYTCKSFQMAHTNKKKKNSASQETKGTMFINAEDEILHKKATVSCDYDVSDEGDVLVAGKWGSNEDQMTPYRTVMVIPWSQMDDIVTEMQQFVE